jgi:hypothetical protein
MAGRIRTIKPDLLDQERFAQLTDAGVRLFTGCLALVDDAGVCPAGPTYLGGRIFYARPRSPISIGKLLAELERARLVDLFVVDLAHYLAIIGWAEKGAPTYQRIDKPQASRFPLPTSVRSWNGVDAGSDPIRSDPKGSEPARAIAGVAPGHEPPPPPPPPPVTPVAAPRHAIVPAVPPPAPSREDTARTHAAPYDHTDDRSRGRLAEATYQRVSDARVALAVELRLPAQLPFPPVTPSSRGRAFVDLLDRVREEGPGAPAACDRVVASLIAQARETRGPEALEWLSQKAFGSGAWATARERVPGAKRSRPGARPEPVAARAPVPTARETRETAPLQVSTLTPEERIAAAAADRELLAQLLGEARAPPASSSPTPDQQPQSRPKAAT